MKLISIIRRSPATALLILVNTIVFIITFASIGNFSEPEWTYHLLQYGAEFNPYTLQGEWYRILTHMFMHGSVLHLLFNMYALFSVGSEVEGLVGYKKFLLIYLISGVGAALSSLYWSLFTVGVGASGAIFGLFGFSLIISLLRSKRYRLSRFTILINFGLFLILNLLMAKALNADTAAHIGGLFSGIILALVVRFHIPSIRQIRYEVAFIPILIVFFFLLPRNQVSYFNFFQYMIGIEDSTRNLFASNPTDQQFANELKKYNTRWDSAFVMLRSQTNLPTELKSDTTKLSHYMFLRRLENEYRITMVQRESYIYMDSIQLAQEGIENYRNLKYYLRMYASPEDTAPREEDKGSLEQVKVLYNEEWVEVDSPPFTYYRIGNRDSLGRWQGWLTDFYANGDAQMKGRYKNNERDGIFLYYTDHQTYSSAGRCRNDYNIGKWEFFHSNGKLRSEVFYTDRYFLKSLWDSAGNQFVKDGYGKVVELYPNGVVRNEGEYRDGYKEGYWYGRHSNGLMLYEENYYRGRLINGRSRSPQGETYIYDETSFSPLPVGGYKKLKDYIQNEVKQLPIQTPGKVRLSFRVTDKGTLADFKILKSVSREADLLAQKIVKEGPRWMPAKEYGFHQIDGFAYAEVDF